MKQINNKLTENRCKSLNCDSFSDEIFHVVNLSGGKDNE